MVFFGDVWVSILRLDTRIIVLIVLQKTTQPGDRSINWGDIL